MKCNWKKLAAEAVNTLSSDERAKSIVYLEQRIIPAREYVPWSGIAQSFDEPVVIAFADLEPALNWTHAGRYLILNTDGGIRATLDVNRPPYLTQVSPDLRLIHRGNEAPEWAVITTATVE